MTEPTVTRTDEYGHVEVRWPNPIAHQYPMSVELIQQIVDLTNEVADIREAATANDWPKVAVLWGRLMEGTA